MEHCFCTPCALKVLHPLCPLHLSSRYTPRSQSCARRKGNGKFCVSVGRTTALLLTYSLLHGGLAAGRPSQIINYRLRKLHCWQIWQNCFCAAQVFSSSTFEELQQAAFRRLAPACPLTSSPEPSIESRSLWKCLWYDMISYYYDQETII